MASLFRKSLRAFLPASFALALIFGLIALIIMDRLYGEVMADSLGAAAAGFAAELPAEELASLDAPGPAIDAWARRLDAATGLRISLVRKDGRVVADSRADPASMENHAARPEIVAAFAGKQGFARRRSVTLGQELFYSAAPVRSSDSSGIIAVLRVAVDLPAMAVRLDPAREELVLAALVLAGLAALAAFLFSRGITRPLARLASAARRVGNPGRPASAETTDDAFAELRRASNARGPEELRLLGAALTAMASELDARARSELVSAQERSAILEGMTEAVFALDASLRLSLANRAARGLFTFAEEQFAARPLLLEVTRSVDLVSVATECLASGTGVERELALYLSGGERWFQVVATPLGSQPKGPEAGGRSSGLVIVMNDISRVRRLERVRKDFVANVSHELRTPIQLVKGFAETLREGNLGESDTERYLGIIERNARRMGNLIEDLLSLARLEQDGDAKGSLERSQYELGAIVAESIEAVAANATAKGIIIGSTIEAGLSGLVNEGLLVQALVNLLDNAVKYCPAGTPVSVEVHSERAKDSVSGLRYIVLTVIDKGPGIPARHLSRIFERFYRIDGARSRELGGTGLGLAIVRHIALAHEGDVNVESYEGEGTRFTLRLPG
jgi:two-component system phosphate regulon sensor histidine kinase PhoR